MARQFFDHTGDIGVRVAGTSLEAVFKEAALALTETLTDLAGVAVITAQPIQMASPTLDDLLVDWLDELLYRFEVRNLLVADVDIRIAEAGHAGWQLEGMVRGEAVDSARHAIKLLVKGVTYHQLQLRRAGDLWETSVVFDI